MQSRIKQAARASFHQLCNKLMSEHSEEADANARLLDVAASMTDARKLPAMFVRDVESLPLAFMLRDDAAGSHLICSCDVIVSIAGSWAAVFGDVVDASTSEVSGPGMIGFVRHDSARNSIGLVPRLSSGAMATVSM
jgi:hypothetical protein